MRFLKQFPSGYYWRLLQVEYSWDLSRKRAADLAPVYAEISRQAILAGKAPDVAKFLFSLGDLAGLLAILCGDYHISGLNNRLLQRVLTGKKGGHISRFLKRLGLHGLIRKIGHTCKYYVTAWGQRGLIAALKLKEHLILPTLMSPASTS